MNQITHKVNNHPIDVVIAWVDGSDPRLKEKRERYMKGEKVVPFQGTQNTRFASNNEIRYCVLSILKFAPFVRNIFIVTDEQDPNIFDDVKRHFPNRINTIRIVDHKEIFKGFEEFLPTFNSISIGNMAWRIEGLSESFVYFNDDVFLVREVKPEDWVKNNKPVMRGRWILPPYLKIFRNYIRVLFNRYLLGNRNYKPKFSFHLVQWNAARIAGMRFRLFFNCHTPHVVNRKTVEGFYTQNLELLMKNLSFRFREQSQFNVTTLANHLEIVGGNKNTAKLNLGYLVPSYYSKRRTKSKMRRCEVDTDIKSVCVQSLDTASKEDQDMIFAWMNKILNLSTS